MFKKFIFIWLVLVGCNPYKFYKKDDYVLYEENFKLDQKSKLRIDGVYLLQSNDLKEKNVYFYKFFIGGQFNMYKIPKEKFKENYSEIITEDFNFSNNHQYGTQFQGYYKLKEDKLILENFVAATSNKFFSYFKILNNGIFFLAQRQKNLGFDHEFFNSEIQKENSLIYRYVKLDQISNPEVDLIKPNW